jgi:DNA-binding NarL/FixJ family response regulator
LNLVLGPLAGSDHIEDAWTWQVAIEKLKCSKFDFVLLQSTLQGGVGPVQMILECKRMLPQAKTILISDERRISEERIASYAGADGHYDMHDPVEILIGTVRSIINGVNRPLIRAEDYPQKSLSKSEYRVFVSFGEGRTAKDIAEQLGDSVKTINSLRDRIRAKLEIGDASELVWEASQWVQSESHLEARSLIGVES